MTLRRILVQADNSAPCAARVHTARAVAERFPTGSGHFVFDVRPHGGGTPVVVRMGRSEQRQEMGDGLHLMQRLAELGVPLPSVLASGAGEALPWVVLQRLAGTDLGDVIGQLHDGQLQAIAIAVIPPWLCPASITSAPGGMPAARIAARTASCISVSPAPAIRLTLVLRSTGLSPRVGDQTWVPGICTMYDGGWSGWLTVTTCTWSGALPSASARTISSVRKSPECSEIRFV